MKSSYKVGSVKQFIDISGLNEEDEVIRKQFNSDITLLPEEEKTIVSKISAAVVDADGDYLDASGCDLKRFMSNPVIHKNHSYKVEDVVGKALEISADSTGITAKIKFADTAAANDVWSLVKGKFVRANSIGFITRQALVKGTEAFTNYVKEKAIKVDDACRRIITKFELIESSICSIPCNPDALNVAISAKSIELSEKTIKELDLPKPSIVPEKVEEVKTITDTEKVIDEILKSEVEEVEIEIGPTEEELKAIKEAEEIARLKKIEDNRVWKVIREGGVVIEHSVVIEKKSGKIV